MILYYLGGSYITAGRQEVREKRRCLAASFEDWRKKPKNAGGPWELKKARKHIRLVNTLTVDF